MYRRGNAILGSFIVAVLIMAAFVQQAQAAGVPAATASVTVTVRAPHVTVVHRVTARYYTVRPGDSLSLIAQRYYGSYRDWPSIYNANRSRVSNPDVIMAGWTLVIPHSPSASPASPRARSARSCDGDRDSDDVGCGSGIRVSIASHASPAGLSGTLSYAGLEALWRSAGGAGWAAATAACIAEHESGGRQYATGAAGERGYWQIHPDHGALSTYNAYGNARAAVIISGDGRSWAPWTTHIYCGV